LEQDYDLIVATSMVDLSALRGFVPALGTIPTLVYFHENQFAYPQNANQVNSIEPSILNLYTALAADKCAFNSDFNRTSFLDGAKKLLDKLPDYVPAGLIEQLSQNSTVLPVPLELSCFQRRTNHNAGPLKVLWNHRWEYDKAPDRLFSGLKVALESGADMELYIVGQQFRRCPDVFVDMHDYLTRHYSDVLQHWGFIDSDDDYKKVLLSSDVVLSTALHDFQGLSVLEAVAAGCIPVVPARLCYGEWFSDSYQYTSNIDNPEAEARSLGCHLARLSEQQSQGKLPESVDLRFLSISSMREAYEEIFRETIDHHSKHSD
jgi:glycosyltransferase involved in cell wall biosynthesis